MMNSQEEKKRYWFEKNPKKTIFLFIVFIFSALAISAEIVLRLSGERAGIGRPGKRLIRTAKELEVIYPFITDEEGIFKANKVYTWESGRFGKGVMINSDGFRSVEFENYHGDKKKVLFLGDSFTWGASAEPITNCFVDLISKQGYTAYNTGIPGTDPRQYAYLADKYIPLLKPDFVIVMLYMGNDLSIKPGLMVPEKNLYYITDDIWLYAFDENGNYLTLEESFYRYYYLDYSPSLIKNKIKYLLASTVMGKKTWQLAKSFKNKRRDASINEITKNVSILLMQVKQVATENNATFLLFLIPAHPHLENIGVSKKNALEALGGLDPLVPDSLSLQDYCLLPDDHLNNSGHYKMSRFIISEISKR